jgi:hypothetical protein
MTDYFPILVILINIPEMNLAKSFFFKSGLFELRQSDWLWSSYTMCTGGATSLHGVTHTATWTESHRQSR